MSVNLNRYEDGFALLQQSLECSAQAGEPPRPLALISLALAALVQNRPDDARRMGLEAVEVARRVGDPYDLGESLGHCGSFIALTSDDRQGIELADEAVEIAADVAERLPLVVHARVCRDCPISPRSRGRASNCSNRV